ncbi:hypothetical protein BBK82_07420 [Lentzea guizhouensis]|uniref:Uncharacterized protein n=1 Tax=Lentzea guizhouensis TaxID=1586287 RepID=A0A1B2HDX4_9PSEU|nr:hypothetical protein BBK82_07420 [Lentzea guizhouensis]
MYGQREIELGENRLLPRYEQRAHRAQVLLDPVVNRRRLGTGVDDLHTLVAVEHGKDVGEPVDGGHGVNHHQHRALGADGPPSGTMRPEWHLQPPA